MTRPTVLVAGATGRLGRMVVEGLRRRGAAVRVIARQPEKALLLFGHEVQVVRADLDAPDTLRAAVEGVERVFLLSPIGPQLAQQQIALVKVALAAGVQRVVKLSGSDWTLHDDPDTSVSGQAHLAVEKALAASGLPHVVLRPNAWMQVALARVVQALRAGAPLHDAFGGAAVSYIDIRDIADVAVDQLLADAVSPQPLVLTGGQSVTLGQVAAIAQEVLARPVEVGSAAGNAPAAAPHESELPAFVRVAHGQFAELIRAGVAAGVTGTVPQVLGRPARAIEDFLREQLDAPV